MLEYAMYLNQVQLRTTVHMDSQLPLFCAIMQKNLLTWLVTQTTTDNCTSTCFWQW